MLWAAVDRTIGQNKTGGNVENVHQAGGQVEDDYEVPVDSLNKITSKPSLNRSSLRRVREEVEKELEKLLTLPEDNIAQQEEEDLYDTIDDISPVADTPRTDAIQEQIYDTISDQHPPLTQTPSIKRDLPPIPPQPQNRPKSLISSDDGSVKLVPKPPARPIPSFGSIGYVPIKEDVPNNNIKEGKTSKPIIASKPTLAPKPSLLATSDNELSSQSPKTSPSSRRANLSKTCSESSPENSRQPPARPPPPALMYENVTIATSDDSDNDYEDPPSTDGVVGPTKVKDRVAQLQDRNVVKPVEPVPAMSKTNISSSNYENVY